MRMEEVKLVDDCAGNVVAAATDDDDDDDGDELEVVKKEAMEEGQTVTVAVMDNSRTPSPSTPSLNSFMVKRKKVKEMKERVLPLKKKKMMMKKNKNKKFSGSKSNHVVTDNVIKTLSCKRKRNSVNRVQSLFEVKSPAMIRAEEVRSSLGNEFPSFIKVMVRSHVTKCFWMGVPLPFSKLHLPTEDLPFILEDESGEQFEVRFIANRAAFSGGWRNFAAMHNLLEGDAVVFQLVEATKFKVHITRANDLTEVDGALSLLNLDAPTNRIDAEDDAKVSTALALKNTKRKQRPRSLPSTTSRKNNKKTSSLALSRPARKVAKLIEESEEDSEASGSDIQARGSAIRIRDVESFEEFKIVVNGVCIDSELPRRVRLKYYELCRSKNAILHARLLKGLNCVLAAGVVFETVDIAEAMKACKVTTSWDEFTRWEKTLKSFELLGMNVGFLRGRLRRLRSLAFEEEGASEARRYVEAKTGRAQAEDEMRDLEEKIVELKEASEKLDADIEAVKSKAEVYELKFQEEVNAPW